jgi:hypothetical protein
VKPAQNHINHGVKILIFYQYDGQNDFICAGPADTPLTIMTDSDKIEKRLMKEAGERIV